MSMLHRWEQLYFWDISKVLKSSGVINVVSLMGTITMGRTAKFRHLSEWYSSELESVKERMVEQLSGGELQRFAIAMCIVQQADVYMFDEPSSYLDVKQRLNAAKIIRELVTPHKWVSILCWCRWALLSLSKRSLLPYIRTGRSAKGEWWAQSMESTMVFDLAMIA